MTTIDPNETTAHLAQVDQQRAQAKQALDAIIQGYRDSVALNGEDHAFIVGVATVLHEVDPRDTLPPDMSNALTFTAELLTEAIRRLSAKDGVQ
ncbi:hypothetical protein A5722_14775 [Mycobacterium vulneris]|nr:hypothetical protein A5722_14775 [Mycolicibacterium vulneris]OCB66193.1 hypothetical protein A5729_12280 [Mycolicibacterium vulneris]